MKLKGIAQSMEYPGRFLIVQHASEYCSALYGVTARSAASKAKRYVLSSDSKTIHVVPTDAEVMGMGDASLLDYTAVHFFDRAAVIGNGRQTNLVTTFKETAVRTLEESLAHESFEPDKYSTPRITGVVSFRNNEWTVGLSSIRNDGHGNAEHGVYDVPVGSTKFFSTYAGPNVRPTPSFVGDPINITELNGSIEEMVTDVFDTFAPISGGEDVRVSVVGVRIEKKSKELTHYIKNTL